MIIIIFINASIIDVTPIKAPEFDQYFYFIVFKKVIF